MPKRSTVKQLPQTVKDWLDAALVENNFSDYSALEEALKARGYDISRSAVPLRASIRASFSVCESQYRSGENHLR